MFKFTFCQVMSKCRQFGVIMAALQKLAITMQISIPYNCRHNEGPVFKNIYLYFFLLLLLFLKP